MPSAKVHFSNFWIGRKVLGWRAVNRDVYRVILGSGQKPSLPVAMAYAVNITMKTGGKMRGLPSGPLGRPNKKMIVLIFLSFDT